MNNHCKYISMLCILASWSTCTRALGETVGTVTITDAHHYGYFLNPTASAHNTKATVGPFSGTARTIRVPGADHMGLLDRPETGDAIRSFIEDLPA